MKELATKLLKHMIDKYDQTHHVGFHFDEFQKLCPDATESDLADALNYLSHHGYIKTSSYSNIPYFVYLVPSAYYGDDADSDNIDGTSTSKATKKQISINWVAIGVIAPLLLSVITYIIDKFF